MKYYQSKRGISAAILILLFSSLFIFIPPAEASYIQGQQLNAFQQVVSNYAKKIEDSYDRTDRDASSDPEMKLAAEQVVDSQELAASGLYISQVKVKAVTSSVKQVATNYEIKSNITTDLLLKPSKDAEIVIAGQKRDVLHSSATDIHILTVETKSSDNNSFMVTGDKIQNPIEDDEQIDAHDFNNDGQDRSVLVAKSSKKIYYDSIKASLYAEKWTEKDVMNPDFPIYKEDGSKGNCTNFVSQAVYAGGIPTTFGTSFDVWTPKVWTWNLAGIAGASVTWSGAEYNYRYMKNYAGVFKPDDAWKIGFGGIIYADWENKGQLGHAMFVVGYAGHRDKPSPVICQKTVNRHDWPFSTSVKTANKHYHGKTRWVGLQSLY